MRYNQSMATSDAIATVVQQIALRFRPNRIILFGSHAYGKPRPDSDVDLLIIMRFTGHPARKAAQIWRSIDSNLPLDLLVRTPRQIATRVRGHDFFLCDVIRKGKVMYDAADAGVDRKSRRRLQQRAQGAAGMKAA